MPQLIWTNHVLERARERKISEDFISQTFDNPDKTIQDGSSRKYEKVFGNQTVTAVVKKNENNEDVLVSCWIEPPNPGTHDFKSDVRYKEKNKSGLVKKIWLTFLEQIGL